MADEFKSIKDNLFKILASRIDVSRDEESDDYEATGAGLGLDASAAKALLAAVFARAGKGKDEVVQIVAREIGLAVAAMLKEPLAQLAKHQRLQISFEFVPKEGHQQAVADEDEKTETWRGTGHKARPRRPAAKRNNTRRRNSST